MILLKAKLNNLTKGEFNKFFALLGTVVSGKKLDTGTEYKIYLTDGKDSALRSNQQNKYLWGVVYKTLSDATGFEIGELHEIFKLKFGLRTRFDFGGEVIEYPLSTSKFTKEEMMTYLDSVIRWGAERGIEIPDAKSIPDEIYVQLHSDNKI